MKYDVVIVPETFHKFDKHNIEHICVPIVIEDRSYDIAVELLDGLDRALRARFEVSLETPEGDDCDIFYRKYRIKGDGKSAVVHAKLRKSDENCPQPRGNLLKVLEFERDIAEIISEIEGCLH